MNQDDHYTTRQAQLDRQYQDSFSTPEARAWIESMSPDERRRLEADGLLKPMLDRAGSTMRDEDAGESDLAAVAPDFAAAIDCEQGATVPESSSTAADVLASFCARIRGRANPALVFDAICYATGVTDVEGVSATQLAARHGITKQAFSKIAVEWCRTFGLQPSRSMKSKAAREAYRERAKRVHQRRKLTKPQST